MHAWRVTTTTPTTTRTTKTSRLLLQAPLGQDHLQIVRPSCYSLYMSEIEYDDMMYDADYEDYCDYDCQDEPYYNEAEDDLDFTFECDSALASAGWGTDEDYGYYGDDY